MRSIETIARMGFEQRDESPCLCLKMFFLGSIFLMLGFNSTSVAASDARMQTVVLINGDCDLRVNNQKLDCDRKLIYTEFSNHRIELSVLPKILAVASFSGGRDLQFTPEHYQVTIDRLILSGGNVAAADGYCSVELRADGNRVYKAECRALTHDGRRFEMNFVPDDEAPSIEHFRQ